MKKKGITGEVLGAVLGPIVILFAVLAVPFDDRESRHLKINWQSDFATAQKVAQRSGKPILAVAIAGEIKGRC